MSEEVNEESSRQWLTDLWLQVKNAEDERVYYDDTAHNYEDITSNLNWKAPQLCMRGLTNYEEKSGITVPRDGIAIDIGAGTGLSGQALRDIGFTGQIDALEPSSNMYAIAEPKGIYTNYFNELLLEDTETSVPSEKYDLAFSVGVFSDRSAKSSCLADLVRMVKPGGGHVAVICVKRHWDGDLELVAKRLEQEGKVDIKHVEVFQYYMKDVVSVSFVLQKK